TPIVQGYYCRQDRYEPSCIYGPDANVAQRRNLKRIVQRYGIGGIACRQISLHFWKLSPAGPTSIRLPFSRADACLLGNHSPMTGKRRTSVTEHQPHGKADDECPCGNCQYDEAPDI